MSIAIVITAIIGIRQLKKDLRFRKDSYLLDRQNVSYRLLKELNNTEFELHFILSYLTEETAGSKIYKKYPYEFRINRINSSAYEGLFEKGTSYKNKDLLWKIIGIYNHLEFFKESIKHFLDFQKEIGEEIKKRAIKNNIERINEILERIRKVYQEFIGEIGFDFVNSDYYLDPKTLKLLDN